MGDLLLMQFISQSVLCVLTMFVIKCKMFEGLFPFFVLEHLLLLSYHVILITKRSIPSVIECLKKLYYITTVTLCNILCTDFEICLVSCIDKKRIKPNWKKYQSRGFGCGKGCGQNLQINSTVYVWSVCFFFLTDDLIGFHWKQFPNATMFNRNRPTLYSSGSDRSWPFD